MDSLKNQVAYWNTAGATKTFTHPVNVSWLEPLSREARVLDYGCGYGRVLAELKDQGFSHLTGVDVAANLIARGRAERPDLSLAVLDSPPTLPYEANSFDLVLLFAVLTCIPKDEDQQSLIQEVDRVLAPGGTLYISDVVLQDDDRNRKRYADFAEQSDAPYGVFATEDGAVCRHHTLAHLRALLTDFDLIQESEIAVTTMNGHPCSAAQLLARK